MRYIIGIDLGTTNCCVSYVDTHAPRPTIQKFRIPQLTGPGTVEAAEILPSFCYLAAEGELPTGALQLPWSKNEKECVGCYAQDNGARIPTRLISSAKSWLCHAAASRRERILPFEAAEEIRRLSPTEAIARYLAHIRCAWNHQMAKKDVDAALELQEVIITVPASFDEVARTLTADAARMAGIEKLTFLEEPQAAFYSWIAHHESECSRLLKAGDKILVCDVGGGTTDFSLIEVEARQETIAFQRVAVGDHLLLGGDNIDLTLAHWIEKKLSNEGAGELSTRQWMQLVHLAKTAKETLLDGSDDMLFSVTIAGEGSNVIQGMLTTEICAGDVKKLLQNGFFPLEEWAIASALSKAKGIRSMGLPYEEDPAITRHLARFLSRAGAVGEAAPTYILFNGGTVKPLTFQARILASLQQWFPETSLTTLTSSSLDLAVAHGAAYYGKVRRGLGVRIGGGSSRAYYLAMDIHQEQGNSVRRALTLLPRGSEEGTSYMPSQQFKLIPNEKVVFQLYRSHVRLNDAAGDFVDIDLESFQPLPPLQTVIRYGKQASTAALPVTLLVKMTEIGTVELWLESVETLHKWQLEFQLKSTLGYEEIVEQKNHIRKDQSFDISLLAKALDHVNAVFNKENTQAPDKLIEKLENILECPRMEWPPSVCRAICDVLLKMSSFKNISLEHEFRWWNTIGFCLRPGCGHPVDDWRLKEIWKCILAEQGRAHSQELLVQQWICFRRIAGGLNKGQQQQLVLPLLKELVVEIQKRSKGSEYLYMEKLRTVAAMELLDLPAKKSLGQALLDKSTKQKPSKAECWALARLGARRLLCGSPLHVLPRELCTEWTEKLMEVPEINKEQLSFVLSQYIRQTDQRELNLSQAIVKKVKLCCEISETEATQNSGYTLEEKEQLLGEQLPAGLCI